MLRDIQGFEVVVVPLHIRPFDCLEAHVLENPANVLKYSSSGVKPTYRKRPTRQGEI
jgi:hypothetical protein